MPGGSGELGAVGDGGGGGAADGTGGAVRIGVRLAACGIAACGRPVCRAIQ